MRIIVALVAMGVAVAGATQAFDLTLSQFPSDESCKAGVETSLEITTAEVRAKISVQF